MFNVLVFGVCYHIVVMEYCHDVKERHHSTFNNPQVVHLVIIPKLPNKNKSISEENQSGFCLLQFI